MSSKPISDVKPDDGSRAVTDVPSFINELEAGQIEHALSVAMSETAAACVDSQKKGEVLLKLIFSPIKGTHQVEVLHQLKFTRPTLRGGLPRGKKIEQDDGATVFHVGRFGKLTITQPQLDGVDKQAKVPGA